MMPISGSDPGWLQMIDGLTAERKLRGDLQARARLRASDEVELYATKVLSRTLQVTWNDPSTVQYIYCTRSTILHYGVHSSAEDAQYCTVRDCKVP